MFPATAVRLRYRSETLVKFNSQSKSAWAIQGEFAPKVVYTSVCTRDARRCITVYQCVVFEDGGGK